MNITFINFVSGLMFEIAEGGFLDIDVKIIGPDGKVIYQGERETSGKYTFAAHMEGVYTYCFSNQMSTMTPKIVMFNMEIDEPTNKDDPKDAEGKFFFFTHFKICLYVMKIKKI